MQKPIPDMAVPEMYEGICPIASPLVRLTQQLPFDIQMQYPALNPAHAVADCYVRQEVLDRLMDAQKLLPPGYRLRIWDAWRPFALQQALYDTYTAFLTERFSLDTLPPEQQARIIAKYISYPNDDPMLPPVHTTGGAVDLTLVGPDGKELDMGTKFDEFTEKAATAYFEQDGQDETVRENRRLLYGCMIEAGFTNLPSEWWHYDYGDRMWAHYNNSPALYKGIFTQEELERNETENKL